jgi:hypothetical protein
MECPPVDALAKERRARRAAEVSAVRARQEAEAEAQRARQEAAVEAQRARDATELLAAQRQQHEREFAELQQRAAQQLDDERRIRQEAEAEAHRALQAAGRELAELKQRAAQQLDDERRAREEAERARYEAQQVADQFNTRLEEQRQAATEAQARAAADTVQRVAAAERQGEANSLRKFTFAELALATDNFQERNRIGKGGFSAVFRGVLPDLCVIAVKRLQNDAAAAAAGLLPMDQILAERHVLHRFPHPHLVQLMGVSNGDIPCIVYPIMRGGSLADRFRRSPPLLLATRLRIAADVCLALAHVHHSAKAV